ncbi:MAG TPA: potassium-transporting ATPase subunit KdpC [Tepidisphaeraceae bacterium]|nr:potassium-transporting ATPase subunit KdpC [Tepidisphaeraceae bacterium]
MLKQLRASIVILLLLTAITGVAYPFAITVIAKTCFPRQAAGSLLANGAGSKLIGQPFDDPRYFWGRPSATVDAAGKPLPYNAAGSGGSNLSPTNPQQIDLVKSRVEALQKSEPGNTAAIPVDLVTASASGLDPHITPAAADYQVHRIAVARHLPEQAVRDLVRQHTESRQLGVLGEPRVNVLELNIAIDSLQASSNPS